MNPIVESSGEQCAPSSASAPFGASAATPFAAGESIVMSACVPPQPTLVRQTHDRRRLETWGLVLVARGIQSYGGWSERGFELHVAPEHFGVARAELDAADVEERETQRARQVERTRVQRPATRHYALGGALVASLLLAFFALTGPRASGSAWFAAGASDAERVLHGEWWRAVTALTLHADSAHVASNVGIGALVVGAVMRTEGVGWGSALVLAAGTAGNLLNAWAHQSFHSSVGFSTAVFGAIGLLGGLGYARARANVPGTRSARPAWTALAGSVALLAALGSGERSDVYAHLFGGLAGVGIGLAVGFGKWRPQSWAGQWLVGLTASALVIGAWFVALA